MTTFAPTFTPRYKAHYHAAGIDHSMTIRGQRGESQTAVENRGDSIGFIFALWNSFLADDFAYLFAEYCPQDVDVFVPARLPVYLPVGEVPTGDMTVRERITGTTFSGKSSNGRARFTLFGIRWVDAPIDPTSQDFKVTAAEDARIASTVTEANGKFQSAGNLPATFHNQATIKEWDNLVKLARRGLVG